MHPSRPVRIAAAEPLSGFTMRLTFTDGSQKTVDLEPFLLRGPIFEPLRRDPALFRAVRIDRRAGTICWDNGADLDPDVLYHGWTPAWMEDAACTEPLAPNS